ncbi:hypothetical protein J7M28_12080 [bacterium]|nr:hypothetical protein [bacterium]
MRVLAMASMVAFVLFCVVNIAVAAEYHVKQDGSGDFATIQDAIDASIDGDAIIVHPARTTRTFASTGRI